MKIALTLLLLVITLTVSATKYYVSSSGGSDSNDGKTESTAWKTISKVNGSSLSPGDIVAFKSGDQWRETLKVPSSGSSSSYIVFTNYGSGVKPRILGSVQATSWTNQGSNIWRSSTSCSNPSTYGNIFFVNSQAGAATWGVRKSATSALVAEFDWTWSSNNIYVYSATDPSVRYTSVEAAQRMFSIDLNDKNYVEVNGIDMFYCTWGGVLQHTDNASFTGFTMRNCESAYHGDKNGYGYGVYLCYNNTLIEDCVFHDTGRRGVSINNYSNYDISNVLIQRCTFYNGFHTTGPDIEAGTSTSGDLTNVTVRYCLIYDDPDRKVGWGVNSVFVQGPHGGSGAVYDFNFYCNIVKYPHGNAVSLERVYGAELYNNTFCGHNPNWVPSYSLYADTYCTDVVVKNNIFYTTSSTESQGHGAGMVTYAMSDSEVDANYNLYYRISNSLRIALLNGTSYYMNTIASLRTQKGYEINSPVPADPKFVSANDFHLQAGSPAIGKGVAIPGITTDFEGKPLNNPPDIGCLAFSGSYNSPPIVSITSPTKSNSFTAPADITIAVSATDPDGTISKVEFYNGAVKLGEINTYPYSFVWKGVPAGSYSLTVRATDNMNSTTVSSAVSLEVSVVTALEPGKPDRENADKLLLYPNPNNGRFSIDLTDQGKNDYKLLTIFDLSGKVVYKEILQNGESTRQVDVSNYPSGTYIIKVNGNIHSASSKFLKN